MTMNLFTIAFTFYFLYGVSLVTRIIYVIIDSRKNSTSITKQTIAAWVFAVVAYIPVYMFWFPEMLVYMQAIPLLALGIVLALNQTKSENSNEQ